MYKTLFFLSSVLAEVTDPFIDCSTGAIASEDILTGLTGAPQNSGDCVSKCTDSCADVSCLNSDDVADCSYDVNAFDNGLTSTAVTDACIALAGKWTLGAQDWSTMTKVTVTFGGVTGGTLSSINLGVTDCTVAPSTDNQATCTSDNVCDITSFVKTVLPADNLLIAMDTGNTIDLSTATASITATSGHVYAAAPTCTAKTSQSDCEGVGCKWCYDSAATPEGYKGCGVSPSVCQNDGTSSTTSSSSTASTSTTTTTTSAGSDSLLSVGFAAMIGAFIFKFM